MVLKLAYKWRGFLTAPPLVFSAIWFQGEYEQDLLTWPLGVLLFFCGWGLRIWAQQHLGYRLRIQRVLTTSGPYAFVRNPIYIGNALLILGMVVTSKVLWMLPLTLLWCAAIYAAVVRHEERRLAERYGPEYLAYTAAVPRWVPRLASPCQGVRRPCSLRRALLAELHVVLFIVPFVLKDLVIAPFIE